MKKYFYHVPWADPDVSGEELRKCRKGGGASAFSIDSWELDGPTAATALIKIFIKWNVYVIFT
jgi:hypothetical protein